jgi:flagellar basal body-associated protein FliL
MHTALQASGTWAPQVPHTLLVVMITVAVVLLVVVLLVATGLMVQSLTGGAPLVPMEPEPGLDL